MTARRAGPIAAVVAAVLASCSAASPSPSVAPTASPAASEAQASGTPTAAVPDCANDFSASDGRVAFTIGLFGGPQGVATINADGSGFQRILDAVDIPGQPHGGTDTPRWTPDGRILVSSNRAGGPDDWRIFIMNADGGDLLQVTGGEDGIEWDGVMSPDGTTIVYAKALPTPDGPAPFGGGGIYASDADGTNERLLAPVPPGTSPEFPEGAEDEFPDVSPDGLRVVFNRSHTDEGGLFVVNIDGTGLTRLIDIAMDPERPRWTPDGQWIVFHTNSGEYETESANLWVIRPDGTGLRQVTHESLPGQAWAADWSLDGEHIVLVESHLDIIGLDGSPTCTLFHGAGWNPDWGPAS